MNQAAVSVVIPVFNEEKSIGALVKATESVLSVHYPDSWEIVCVDDGSTDATWHEITNYPRNSAIKGIRFRKNFSKAAALEAGFRHSCGEVIVTLDGDLQDDPTEIPDLIKLLDRYDLVTGWKSKRMDSFVKVASSRVFNVLVSFIFGLKLRDQNCGLKVFKREVVDSIELYGELHRFIPILAHAKGFKVGEKAVKHRPRTFGKSKYGLSRAFKGLLDICTVILLTRFKARPLHFFGGIGLAFFGAGGIGLTYLALIWITGSSIGTRPLLTYSLGLFLFGSQLIFTGLIAELLNAGQADGHYTIKEIFGNEANMESYRSEKAC